MRFCKADADCQLGSPLCYALSALENKSEKLRAEHCDYCDCSCFALLRLFAKKPFPINFYKYFSKRA